MEERFEINYEEDFTVINCNVCKEEVVVFGLHGTPEEMEKAKEEHVRTCSLKEHLENK